ncbi:hypothetical protein A11A3_14942 [Alcanivorax hongdengensis A-11-3]|uniref:Uncharacterized protein n=1 Tax=Alcanivorax hongdengensis A-11-3 TaxID=1177179 RepID=L0W885_9GAMM|nr:hypothetical protein [Alcanivorax hongdengensis]EKF73179.1 hypothetical protein A11A3_14942 [Alcanivorax hongdengensis A-11-3]
MTSAPASTSPFREGALPYKSAGIGLATFFGSPLAGGLLLWLNERRRQDGGRPLLALTLALIVLAVSLVLAYYLPANIPAAIFTAVQMVAMALIARRVQGQAILAHTASGRPCSSDWKAVGIGLLFLVVILLVAMPLTYLGAQKLGL